MCLSQEADAEAAKVAVAGKLDHSVIATTGIYMLDGMLTTSFLSVLFCLVSKQVTEAISVSDNDVTSRALQKVGERHG